MVSDFSSLLDKVSQLAELAIALRRENAELRNEVGTLTNENAQLSSRMKEAHDRVSALIDTMPTPSDQETV
jgi:regulator of replication initiation timing